MVDDASVYRVGALAAFGVASGYVLTGIFAVMMPPQLQGRPDISPHVFWTTLSQNPHAHLCFHWSWVLAGLCGIAAVPSISLLVWARHRGAVLWSGLAALSGFMVMARSHLMESAWDRRIIRVYETADPAFQQAVHVVAGLALDIPDGVFTCGAPGVWIAVVSVLAIRERALPRSFAYLGFGTAATMMAATRSGANRSCFNVSTQRGSVPCPAQHPSVEGFSSAPPVFLLSHQPCCSASRRPSSLPRPTP